MLPLERFEKLPGLSGVEKARIYVAAVEAKWDWDELIPAGLSDFMVAETLKVRFPSAAAPRDELTACIGEVSALEDSVPLFSFQGSSQPSVEALRSYLLDFKCLQGLVPVASRDVNRLAELPLKLQLQRPFFYSLSPLGIAVRGAIEPPLAGGGEQLRLVMFIRILDRLRRYASSNSCLSYSLSMDHASQSNSTQTARCRKRKRPDFVFEYIDYLFLLGEGEDDERDFTVAREEISAKLITVPGWVYGNELFLLAFAIAGPKWQLFVQRRPGEALKEVSALYDLNNASHRAELALMFIKLYFLCLSISRRVVHTGMLRLFRKHQREFGSVELDGEGCVKIIEKWNEYSKALGARLDSVQKAYRVSIPVKQLVSAVASPTLNRKGRYMVRTAPLGLPPRHRLRGEDEYKRLSRDMLTALAALHKSGLVHRDVRLDNIIWSPERACYVLIDLETTSKAGLVMPRLFADQSPATLVQGFYVESSDLYQLGVLLGKLHLEGSAMSSLMASFVGELQSHDCTAEKMSTHAWLQNTKVIL